MATTSDEEMESLLSSFDQIYEDFKNCISEIQLLRSNCNDEVKKREALQFTCSDLKLDNERLTKLYTGSFNKIADQLKFRTKCRNLEEELKNVSDKLLKSQYEHERMMKLLKQDHVRKVEDVEAQIRDLMLQKDEKQAIINQLHQDLAAHKTHMHTLANRLEQSHLEMESKYHHEIQDLKDCLYAEQEEKKELTKKLQVMEMEKEFLLSRTKVVEHQQDLNSNQNVDKLKEKIMKLRKENELLKRSAAM